MGGKRVAEQVRRALIQEAKVTPVALAIDATGCTKSSDCAAEGPPCKEVPATGTYNFIAVALVFPFDAASGDAMAFPESKLCPGDSAVDLPPLPLESCKKICADPGYELDGKFSDTDKIVSCWTFSVGPPGCIPTEVQCTAEYPPGATMCAVPVREAGVITLYDAMP